MSFFDNYKPAVRDAGTFQEIIGYKAVRANYKPFYGDQTLTYHVGKTYQITGDLIPCKNAFHFCRTLEDVMALFPPKNGTRYLRVSCFVPLGFIGKDKLPSPLNCSQILYLNDLKEYKRNDRVGPKPMLSFYTTVDSEYKYAASKMTIIEEIPFSAYSKFALNQLITTEEEYFKTLLPEDYDELIISRIKEYTNNTFSDGFIKYWASNVSNKENAFLAFRRKFDAIKDEKISQDAKILFMCGGFNYE